MKGVSILRYSKDYLKTQLENQGISYTDEDLRLVQKVMDFIDEGERKLDKFEDLQDTSIFLKNDMEVIDSE